MLLLSALIFQRERCSGSQLKFIYDHSKTISVFWTIFRMVVL